MLRTSTIPMGKVGWVEKKKNVPDDFMVPLQIFSLCVACSLSECFGGKLNIPRYDEFPHNFPNPPTQLHLHVVVKMKILFASSRIHPPSVFLCFCFFYYLFYDCIKWPIVKVNDSQRHKIAHILLWLLSIILFNDKLGLILIYSLGLSAIRDWDKLQERLYCRGGKDFKIIRPRVVLITILIINSYTLSFPIDEPLFLLSHCLLPLINSLRVFMTSSSVARRECSRWWVLWTFNVYGFKELIFSFRQSGFALIFVFFGPSKRLWGVEIDFFVSNFEAAGTMIIKFPWGCASFGFPGSNS